MHVVAMSHVVRPLFLLYKIIGLTQYKRKIAVWLHETMCDIRSFHYVLIQIMNYEIFATFYV